MKKVKVTFSYTGESTGKIPQIKLIRCYLGIGLKEAKDIVDASEGTIPLNGVHILTLEQLGRFFANKYRSEFNSNMHVDAVETFEAEYVDFSDVKEAL